MCRNGLRSVISYMIVSSVDFETTFIYNNNKEPITIKKALSFVSPYFGLMVLAWIVIVIGWYLIGLPLGPESMPNL